MIDVGRTESDRNANSFGAPESMYVFDVDGVITNPFTRQVNAETVGVISRNLRAGIPVALVTGRALRWVGERVVELLTVNTGDEVMANLLVVAEKGPVRSFNEEGSSRVETDEHLTLPAAFKAEARELLEADRGGWSFNDTMFWDEDKQVMASIEHRPSAPMETFSSQQELLATELRSLLATHDLGDFTVDTTVIATDVEHRDASKAYGAAAVLHWLGRKGIAPKTFTVFGDSNSDSRVAQVFGEHSTPTTFVFVGNPVELTVTGQEPYRTIITGGGFDRDVARYLQGHSQV